MSFRFDHAIIGVYDLDIAIQNYEGLGFTVLEGGEHADGATHNALICFKDGSYLELLAPTGKPSNSSGGSGFLSLLDQGEGLLGYALASDDLDADVAEIRSHGIKVGDVQTGGRTTLDGVELRWKSATIEGTRSPFFIQDVTPREDRVPSSPEATSHKNDVNGITELGFVSEDLPALVTFYKSILGGEEQRFNGDVIISLNETTFLLQAAKRRGQRAHAQSRGNEIFDLVLRTSSGRWARNQELLETNSARFRILADVDI